MTQPTQEQLEKIEELAELQFLPKQIAIVVGVCPDEFEEEIFSEDGAMYLCYTRGQLKSEAAIRKSMLQMAKQGSTPAQKQMLEIIAKNKKTLEG